MGTRANAVAMAFAVALALAAAGATAHAQSQAATTTSAASATSRAPASASASASAPAPGTIPFQVEGGEMGRLALQTGAALVVCIALAGAAAYAFARWRKTPLRLLRPAATRHVELVETQVLGAQARLLVVRYDDRQLLLAHTGTAITLLQDKPAAPPAPPTPT